MSGRQSSVSSSESSATRNLSQSSSHISDCADEPLISGFHHVNMLVPPQTLHLAHDFYAGFLGLRPAIVPSSSKSHLAWFEIADSGQQIHINSQHDLTSTQWKAQNEQQRHLCFKILTQEKLDLLQERLWDLYEKGGEGAPTQCDDLKNFPEHQKGPSGSPVRFFARDFAGNRLEFSLWWVLCGSIQGDKWSADMWLHELGDEIWPKVWIPSSCFGETAQWMTVEDSIEYNCILPHASTMLRN